MTDFSNNICKYTVKTFNSPKSSSIYNEEAHIITYNITKPVLIIDP